MLKELRKIEEILDWHPDFDIKKIIRQFKIRRNIIYILLILLLSISISYNLTTSIKNKKIEELYRNFDTIENTLWVNNYIKDSLMNAMESSGYLYYLIEKESKIKIPNTVSKEHVKYMFEQAIDKKIPVGILFRLIHKESRFDSNAVSPTGAYGYMQVVPSTYKLYCNKLNIDPYPITSKKNIYVGSSYLADMYNYWHKKKPKQSPDVIWDYALVTYNVGIANVNDTAFLRNDVNNYINFINK